MPAGTFKVTNLVLDVSVTSKFKGAGRNQTHLQCTTTTTHGLVIGKNATGGNEYCEVSDFHLQYTGTGQPTGATPYAGIFLQRKIDLRNVWVDGFTNDGIYFAPWDAPRDFSDTGLVTRSVFFNMMTNVWVKNCGGAGVNLRFGCNGNGFINCDFSNNNYGFRHHKDGSGAIYSNWVQGGQCSYNTLQGWFIEDGTNFMAYGIYSEGNGNSYTNVVQGADIWVGDNCQRVDINCGNIQPDRPGPPVTPVWRGPASNPGNVFIKNCGAVKY